MREEIRPWPCFHVRSRKSVSGSILGFVRKPFFKKNDGAPPPSACRAEFSVPGHLCFLDTALVRFSGKLHRLDFCGRLCSTLREGLICALTARHAKTMRDQRTEKGWEQFVWWEALSTKKKVKNRTSDFSPNMRRAWKRSLLSLTTLNLNTLKTDDFSWTHQTAGQTTTPNLGKRANPEW